MKIGTLRSLIEEDLALSFDGHLGALSALKGETLLVTGGTGFMGTWLAEAISFLNDRHGFNVSLVLLSRSTDQFRATRRHLAERPDVMLIKADIRHTFELPKQTNWVLHAAGNPDTRFHASNPLETMSVIADGAAAVLRAVDRVTDLKMLLNVSSGLVNGAQPTDLERMPEGPMGAPDCAQVSSAYAEAKRYAETLCAAARSQARIPVATVRPFAFVGPYQSLEQPYAINNFIKDALSGNPIRVLGDGQTVRSYLYAADMAVWLLRFLVGARSGQIFNLGSAEPVRLEVLAEMVANHFSPRPEVRLSTSQSPVHRTRSRLVPEIGGARGFGLDSTRDLKAAIARTLEWNRHQA